MLVGPAMSKVCILSLEEIFLGVSTPVYPHGNRYVFEETNFYVLGAALRGETNKG